MKQWAVLATINTTKSIEQYLKASSPMVVLLFI
jgi:hypothetical protein